MIYTVGFAVSRHYHLELEAPDPRGAYEAFGDRPLRDRLNAAKPVAPLRLETITVVYPGPSRAAEDAEPLTPLEQTRLDLLDADALMREALEEIQTAGAQALAARGVVGFGEGADDLLNLKDIADTCLLRLAAAAARPAR